MTTTTIAATTATSTRGLVPSCISILSFAVNPTRSSLATAAPAVIGAGLDSRCDPLHPGVERRPTGRGDDRAGGGSAGAADDQRVPLAAAAAEGGRPQLGSPPTQLAGQRQHQPGAG